jgi:uncharacterized repeat protein (TIGR03803 family)
LTLSGNTLYGTTETGGTSGIGTVFSIKTDGSGFKVLHSFTGTSGEGANPRAPLSLEDNTLYGTTYAAGSSGNGTVFAIRMDGTGFTTLHEFSSTPSNSPFINNDGALPLCGVVLTNGILYGATWYGGSAGFGTVFSLTLEATASPKLTVGFTGQDILLSWPTNATGVTLQSTIDLASRAWTAVPGTPAVVDGLNVVTNKPSGAQLFYRLSR